MTVDVTETLQCAEGVRRDVSSRAGMAASSSSNKMGRRQSSPGAVERVKAKGIGWDATERTPLEDCERVSNVALRTCTRRSYIRRGHGQPTGRETDALLH